MQGGGSMVDKFNIQPKITTYIYIGFLKDFSF